MTRQTGFSDVDGSGQSAALVEYLAALATALGDMRREDYESLQLAPDAAVLDVGCGAGEVCVDLAQRVGPRGRVAGVDPSEAMIAAARQAATASGPAIELQVASIYALPFPDATFDAVRAERVFQHLDDPEAGLREMIRVARPGARVMVIDPDHSQHGMALDTAEERRVFEASMRAAAKMITNFHVGSRLRAMFLRAGLADVRQLVRAIEIGYPAYGRALFLPERLASAIEAGEITEAQAQRFEAALAARDRAGTFFANAIGYSVVGVKA